MKNILIVRFSYEIVSGERKSNLGNLLRFSILLHLFKDKRIYWLTDKAGYPLLKGNKFIYKLLICRDSLPKGLKDIHFETIINLQKERDIIKKLNILSRDKQMGYFEDEARQIKSYPDISSLESYNHIDNSKRLWQQRLVKIFGFRWGKQGYILSYNPKTNERFDIGFNYSVHHKWKSKRWPYCYWQRLGKLLGKDFKTSWQQGEKNLYHYIDWIQSCRLIVTQDSLGLHLANALKKKIVVLYGSTKPDEFLYNAGAFIEPKGQFSCRPCFKAICANSHFCMEQINPEEVEREIRGVVDY